MNTYVHRVAAAGEIMAAFAERTGLTSSAPPRRYLWTDAFAVCNYLALHRRSQAPHWLEHARALIHQVHHVLGRHRPDDERRGWISGLDEDDGERHPTAGGLRIGKPLPERRSSEPADRRIDWERDGQYYHYLTRWMHALERAAAAWQDAELIRWGVELAQVAHAAFAHDTRHGKRLYWKLSVDLSHPVVSSTGDHDALDGLIAAAAFSRHESGPGTEHDLDRELHDLAAMCADRGWATTDPLGLGLLITNALFLARLSAVPGELFVRILHDAARSLDLVTTGSYMQGDARERLAFRELGLSLGLAAAERLDALRRSGDLPGGRDAHAALDRVLRHAPLRHRIEWFWLDPAHQDADSWTAHEDINAVMLATSILPDGYLD